MTLQQILDHIYSRVNKDQSGNTYNINRFNNDLLVANLETFTYYYGLPEGYQPGAPFPAVSAEITQKVTDSLRHLRVDMGGSATGDPGPMVVNSDGIAPIPEDYVHLSFMNYTYIKDACDTTIPAYPVITPLPGAEWSSRKNSSTLNFRVEKFPYCNFKSNTIEFRPKDIGFVNFSYWRSPLTPHYDYYKDANDAIIFLPTGSYHNLLPNEVGSAGQTSGMVNSTTVELEWPTDTHPTFANLMLSYVSDNLRSEFLKQSSEQRKRMGI